MSGEGIITMDDTAMEHDEIENENVPTNKDIVKKLEMEFTTPQKTSGKHMNSTLLNFDPKKDHMKVYLRIRPFSEDELNRGEDQKCIEAVDDHTIISHAPKDSHTYKNSVHGSSKAQNKFTFSQIFPENTTQKDFFDTSMLGTVKDFVDGQNCLVFTYGVTNSGKTYTIQGEAKDGGVLPRALDVLFNSISGKQMEGMILKPKMFCDVVRLTSNQEEQEKLAKENTMKMASPEEPDVTSLVGESSDISSLTINSVMSEDSLMSRASIASTASTSKQSIQGKDSLESFFEEAENRVREETSIDVNFQGRIKFAVWVSFAEIYNEQIFDLMEPPPKKKNARRTVLHLREDRNGVPYVKGLKEICVSNADEAYKLLTIGKKNLQFACTKLNHNSSRSHCIFTIKLLRVVDKENPNMARMSMLSFCDLAGSERYGKTQSFGERIKEAGNINTSLLTLGRCIKTLRHNQMNKDHHQIVPFRESRLTRIFQGFFCGKGRASMIVNINQVASLYDETLHALKYSAIAQQVIVVQEPEEEKKPPPKKRGIVSLALAQDNRSRATIGWATPSAIAKMIEEEEAGMNLPLPEGDDEDLEEPEDNHLVGLLEIIEDLKRQLRDEKRKNKKMEIDIREEVCKEMAQQLIAIENQYSERVKEAQYLAEEKADKKIELLTMSMKKTGKRKRIMEPEDEDDEYVSSMLLHAEQVKVQEKDKEVGSLKKRIGQMESQLKQLSEEKEAIQEKLSKLQFENQHLNEKLEEITPMADEQYQLLKESRDQVESLDERVRDRDQRIAALEEMLQTKGSDEATCSMCQQKDSDLEKLCTRISEAEDNLEEKNETLEKLQQTIDEQRSDGENQVSTIKDLEDTLKRFTEKQLCDREAQTDECELSKDELAALKSEMESVIESKTEEINTLSNSISCFEKRVKELSEELSGTSTSLKEKTDNLEISQGKVEALTKGLASVELALENKSKEVSTLRNTSGLNEAMKERLNCLEEELQEARQNLKIELETHETDVSKVKEKLKEVEAILQFKELDLTRSGTEAFEALEKVSEGEGDIKKLKEIVENLEEKNTELKTLVENHKNKIVGLECSLSIANENVDQMNELEQEVESLEKVISEKDQHIEKLKKEMGGLSQSLDSESGNVTSLEATIHQANETVRSTALELTNKDDNLKTVTKECEGLKIKLNEKDEELQKIGKEIDEVKAELDSKSEGLDDYILKVNELAESLGEMEEKYNLEKDKVKTLSSRLTDIECEVGMLKSERESESDNEAIDELRATLQSEKEKHQQQMDKFEKQLEEKTRSLERLHVDHDKLKKLYENERKECKDFKSQLKNLECVLENLELELKKEKEQRKANKADSSKLSLQMHEVENKLKEAENQVQEANSYSEELHRKISGLQSSLEVASNIEDELQEVTSKLEQVTDDRDCHLAKLQQLQNEIQDLRCKGDASDSSDEEMEQLRSKIRVLEAKVDDGEYKHQMSMRQMRREKSQIEKLLKETEGTLSEAEDRTSELEVQLKEIKATESAAYEEKLEQFEKKSSKLEAVVQDLEHCLRSSKESEEKVQKRAEEYRQKYRDLENQYATVEDQLKDLYDKRDSIASQKDHEEICFKTVLEQKQQEVEKLRTTICFLKEENASLQNVAENDNSNDSVLCDLRDEISTLQEIIDRNTTDYGKKTFEKNEAIRELEESLAEVKKQFQQQQKNSSKQNDSDSIQLLNVKVSELENLVEEKSAEIEVKQCRVNTLEEDVKQLQGENTDKVTEFNQELQNKQLQVDDIKEKMESVSLELQQLKESKDSEVKNIDDQLQEQIKQVQEITSEKMEKDEKLVILQGQYSELKEKHSGLQVEQERLQEKSNDTESLNTLNEEVTTLKQQLKDVTKTKDSLEAELGTRENSIQNYNKRISLLTEEVQQLQEQLQKSQEAETKLRGQMRDWSEKMEADNAKFVLLKENLRQSQVKVEQLEAEGLEQTRLATSLQSEVEKLKQAVMDKEKEIFQVEREGQKGQDSLEIQRKQLQLNLDAAEKRIDKKNKRIADLLEEAHNERGRYEIAYKDATANEQVIEHLKKALEEQEQVMEMQDSHLKKKEDELESVSKDYETVSEKYNALLKDSAETTSQIRQLEHQQKRTQKDNSEHEQEVQNLKDQINQSKQQLEKIESQKQEIDRIKADHEKDQETLRSQLSEMKHSTKQLKQQLEKTEREKASLDNDIKECTAELRSMEKDLGAARKEREDLRRELEVSRNRELEVRQVKDRLEAENSQEEGVKGQAQLLKQKFQNLEEQKLQLEKEIDHLKDKLKIADEKKEMELQQWRSERDKILGQLKEVMAKKDEEIISLKKQIEQSGSNSPSDDGTAMANLKNQVADRDAIIAELSSHLDKGAPKTRRRRGKNSSQSNAGSDEEVETLRKELASVHQQLESERQSYNKQLDTVLRAKDSIISELKGTNRTLQSQMMHTPGGVMEEPTCIQETPVAEENMAIQCDLEGTPTTTEGDLSTKPPVKPKGKGRGRKRHSSETDEVSAENEDSLKSKGSRGGKRKTTRQQPRTRQKSLRLDENDEPSMGVIKEEDVVDLSMIEHNKSGVKVLNNSTNLDLTGHNLIINSTPKVEQRTATFVSPISDPVPPSTIKKKKRLRKTEDQPFAESPNEPVNGETNTQAADPHKIVKRKLRTRKR